MILSDKCREDFLTEYGGQEWEFNEKYEMILVIEFLESKKYNGQKLFTYVFEQYFKISLSSMSFFDLLFQSIETCNKYYNDNFNLLGYSNGEFIYKKQKP
jgi:hypothetical protein